MQSRNDNLDCSNFRTPLLDHVWNFSAKLDFVKVFNLKQISKRGTMDRILTVRIITRIYDNEKLNNSDLDAMLPLT